MVQRKAPTKINSQSIPTKESSSKEGGGGGGGETKMKKARCINMAAQTITQESMPNYMKPTSSSDARKEQRQVTRNPATPTLTDRKRSKKKLNNLNCSSICSPVAKPVRAFKRKLSSKTLRLSLKKSSGVPPCPKPKVNRATCSSTLKDSKFPKALELSPGATEAGGTSAMKVCPYKYCSLNGHVHDALPPLKCFLASRRRLLQTQKCMKQKGVSPFRKQGSGKDLDTGQAAVRTRSGLEISSLIDEIGSGFFVEIYAKPQEPFKESVKCDERSIQESLENIDESAGAENQRESSKSEEDVGRNLVDKTHEIDSDVSFEEDLDESSDLSIDDLEVMVDFHEYVSCDQEDDANKKKSPSLKAENFTEQKIECWASIDVGKHAEDVTEAEGRMETFDSLDVDLEEAVDPFPDDESNFSEYSDDGLGPILEKLFDVHDDQFFLEIKDTSVTGETAENEIEGSRQDEGNSNSMYDNISESATGGLVANEQDSKTILEDEAFELVNPDSNPKLSDKISEETVLIDNSEEEAGNEEADSSSLSEVQIPAANREADSIDSDAKEEDQIQTEAEVESNVHDGNEISVLPSKTEVTEQSPTDDGSDPNARLNIIRRRANEELQNLRGFNPRAPNFLPEEPDPEAEKVDLRHQMMDERKNAEEWMIDYALQQAVTKLAPARRRKVALLVEAFETVTPLPACDKPLRHDTQSFSNPRPVQACS